MAESEITGPVAGGIQDIGGDQGLSFAKSLCPILRGISSCLGKLFGLGLQAIRRPAKDARRKREPCLGLVTWKGVWSSENGSKSLCCDYVAMVQPAESRQGLNLAVTRRADVRRTTCWRVLR